MRTPKTDLYASKLEATKFTPGRCLPLWHDFAASLETELAASQQREAALRDALTNLLNLSEEVEEFEAEFYKIRIADCRAALQPAAATGYVQREVLQQCVDAIGDVFTGKHGARDLDRNGNLKAYSFQPNSVMSKQLQNALAAANTELKQNA